MGLIINQGNQNTEQDNKFDIIVAENVYAQILELKLSQTKQDTLEVKFKVLSGEYKNRIFFDSVNYNPLSDYSWKYRALRKAAGCPYNVNEGQKVDIEALLLNKAVIVDLSGREGTNRNNEKVVYQNVKYKNPPKKADELTPDTSNESTPFEDDTDPFTGENMSPNTSASGTPEENWGE